MEITLNRRVRVVSLMPESQDAAAHAVYPFKSGLPLQAAESGGSILMPVLHLAAADASSAIADTGTSHAGFALLPEHYM